MRGSAGAVFLTCLLWSAVAYPEEISVPVDYQGRQIQLRADLQRPASGSGPFPVVIALHSCGGYNGYGSMGPGWLGLLLQQGYATLRLDSFTARGYYGDICGNTGDVTGVERGTDALAAAYVLAGRPDVKPDRIAVIGWSHGGSGAVVAARDGPNTLPWREKLATRGGKLVASVALYPGCGDPGHFPVVVPLLVLVGANDDWTPAAPCMALANAQAKPIMTMQVYPNAYHGFDLPNDTFHPFARSSAGRMLGYDAEATANARVRVVEFLNRYLH